MDIGKELLDLLRALGRLLRHILFGWLLYVIGRLRERRRLRQRQREEGGHRRGYSRTRCMPVSEKVYRRPDPLIYSQGYLMAQGIAVTWDNPDIALRKGGVLVPSHALEPDTEYEIVARIWNNSTDAPAVNLPVDFSYLDFGIGTVRVPIGATTVDLPVKGAPGHPTFAQMMWRTPATPGHYCLLVELIWSDDANPFNNLGQENLNVKALNSPNAQFRFPVRNPARQRRVLRLEADGYRIPPQRPCEPERWGQTPEMTRAEIEEHRRELVLRHDRRLFPVPAGWRVEISPRELVLAAEEEQTVTVDITAPDGFRGGQSFNVNAFDGDRLVGGVTLHVTG